MLIPIIASLGFDAEEKDHLIDHKEIIQVVSWSTEDDPYNSIICLRGGQNFYTRMVVETIEAKLRSVTRAEPRPVL